MPSTKTTIQQYPLEKTKIAKRFVDGLVWQIVLFVILFAIHSLFQLKLISNELFLIAFVLVAAIRIWYEHAYFKAYFYDTDEQFLIIRKGVFMPTEVHIPYSKIQDVYKDQDIFDRIFNLWDVHVSTATFMSGAIAHIDGVNQRNGEAIRQLILNKMKKREK